MCVGKTEVDKKIHVEIESLRLEFLYTIFFLRSFFFFFPPFIVPLPSSKPQKPKTILPSSSKSISQNLKPISQIPNPKITISIGPKIQTQKSWFRHQSAMGLTISALEEFFFFFCCGFVFSFLGLCFLGWFVSAC